MKELIAKLLQLKTPGKIGVTVGVVGVLALVFYQFFYSDVRDDIGRAEAQRGDLETEKASYAKRKTRVSGLPQRAQAPARGAARAAARAAQEGGDPVVHVERAGAGGALGARGAAHRHRSRGATGPVREDPGEDGDPRDVSPDREVLQEHQRAAPHRQCSGSVADARAQRDVGADERADAHEGEKFVAATFRFKEAPAAGPAAGASASAAGENK